MMDLVNFVVARAKEPSTWATAVGALGYFGVHPSQTTWQAVTQGAIGLATLLGIALAERGRHAPPTSE